MISEETLKEILLKGQGKNLEDVENSWNNLNEETIQEVGKEKVDSLKEAIEEIEELIENRKKLSKEVISEAESVKTEINNFISEKKLEDPSVMKDQLALRQKQVELAELQLKEKIVCWQDTAQLKKELREKKRELKDRESRISMLNKILE